MQVTRFRRRMIALAITLMFVATVLPNPSAGNPADTRAGALNPLAVCSANQRVYQVTSLPLPIAYNHWGDIDLEGQLYVPDELRDGLLAEVAGKLADAGLTKLASDVANMRAGLAAGQTGLPNALEAAAQLTADAKSAPNDKTVVPTGRVDVSEFARPLVLRAFIGDCVTIRLTNILPVAASIHVHDVVTPPGAGESIGLDAPDLTPSGATRDYTMFIPPYPGMEGAHFLHSHADSRDQTRHGLFGALVAEQPTDFLSSESGAQQDFHSYGLAAIIVPHDGSTPFREFISIYHDEVTLVSWKLKSFPSVSDYGEYGPGTKAIDLRSEPFMDRFDFQRALFEQGDANATGVARDHDKSQSYGSYTYGDPGVIIPMSYLGDPVKFRLINAGPGQYHIHHLHGGGIRWKSTPMAEPSQFAIGFAKNADGVGNIDETQSQRLDVQNMGPGESFSLEPEGGSGGVQQSAGDFLFHCHIVEHYLSGMWSFWRVFNTAQPDLAPLPGREGAHHEAVTSAQLIGHVFPDGTTLTDANIDAWVQAMLPARGVAGEDDASVWDWTYATDAGGHHVYMGEPETSAVWPNYPADAPGRLPTGARSAIGFDINTGKLAYPMLKPHLGKRPPFAPEHGPAPYLKNDVTAQNPQGLCPADARHLAYNLVAVNAAVKYNALDTDTAGTVFVRAQDRAAVQSGAIDPTSILLRANAGDCVDVTLVNALPGVGDSTPAYSNLNEPELGIHWKTNIHIHLVQFDVQASDGVVAGFNYETTIRSVYGSDHLQNPADPSAATVNTVAQTVDAGASTIAVGDITPFLDANGNVKDGSLVGIGMGLPSFEQRHLASVDASAGTITLYEPLAQPHGAGEKIGYEFVHYRWYPDVDLGTVYFHDHINGLDTWRHGLFGSLIVEPRGSVWLDPRRAADPGAQTPAQVAADASAVAHVADIVPGNGLDSFRELVLHFQDRACVDQSTVCPNFSAHLMPDKASEPTGFNLRSNPLWRRDPSQPFSSAANGGDPATDVLHAYPGDKVVIHMLYAGQAASRGVGTFGMVGNRFKVEQYLDGGRTVDAVSMAESTQSNFQLECGAGGCLHQTGDYLYYMTQPEYLNRGAWGIMRVDPPGAGTIQPLSSNPTPVAGGIPAGAPVRPYDITAVRGPVVNNPDQPATSMMDRFVLTSDAASAATGTGVPPTPLVMRAKPGEVVEVTLRNALPSGNVGLSAPILPVAPAMDGMSLGANADSTVAPGHAITYRWYADREIGVVDLVSLASAGDADRGLVAALVVEPAGSSWDNATGPDAILSVPIFQNAAHEHVLMFASQDSEFEASAMPYAPDVAGLTLVNFATEPLTKRIGGQAPASPAGNAQVGGASIAACQVEPQECKPAGIQGHPELRNPLNPVGTAGIAPWTPVITATQGAPLVLRVIGASGDQLHSIHVDGHAWAVDPDMTHCRDDLSRCKSNLVSTVTVGARESHNIWIPSAGQGGAGDYLYRDHRDPFFEGGAWGLLRVS